VVGDVDELVVYQGGRVQDELVLTDDHVVVGGKASPVVLEVYLDEELVVYQGGCVQDELLLVVNPVVVGGKALPAVLDV
jgi:hypothetical protein